MGRARIEILGPFRLLVDGELAEVSRRQVRAVLARLGAATGAVSAGALAEMLWGAQLPADPDAALRVVITRVRAALAEAADQLEYADGFYSLSAACDAQDFAEATDDQSSAQLRDRLGLWRDEPFAGFGDDDWFRFERERLNRVRAALIGKLIAGMWTEGQFDKVELLGRELLLSDPTDEFIVSYVAMACARAGRQTDSLRLIDDNRKDLRTRGLVPSASLTELESEILRGGIDFQAPPLEGVDDGRSTFVGRLDQLSTITETLESGGSVALVGEAGIGKSALLDVLGERLAAVGTPSLHVRAPASADRPLHTMALLVQLALEGAVESGELVIPRLAVAIQRVLPLWESDDVAGFELAGRDDLVERLVEFIVSTAAEHVVIIDDWHWIDSVSAQGLRALVKTRACPVILASRPVDSDSNPLVIDPGSIVDDVITLPTLDHHEVHELIDKDFPGVSTPATESLIRRAGGNPLFIRQLAELVVEGADRETELPATVLVAIKRRLSVLSSRAQRALECAAVLGHDFEIGILSAWIGDSAVDALAEAERASLVHIDPRTNLANFVHALVADGTKQMLSPAQLVALHDEAGRLLENLGSTAATYAVHCVAASELDPTRAFTSCVAAGAQHVDAFSWDEALYYATTASELVQAGSVANVPMGTLLLTKGRALFALGQPESYDALLRCVEMGEAPDIVVDAMIELCHHGSLVLTGADSQRTMAALEIALVAPVSLDRKVQLQAATARLLAYSRDHVRGQTLYKEALKVFDRIDDPHSRRVILRHGEHGLAHPADHDLACEFLDTFMTHGSNDPDLVNHLGWFRYQRAVINADIETLNEAVEFTRHNDELVPRTASYVLFGQTTGQTMQSHWVRSSLATIAGNPELAEEHANAALHAGLEILEARGDGFGQGWVMAGYGSLLLAIRSSQGRLGELRPVIDSAIAAAPQLAGWQGALCGVAHAGGDTATATEILDRFTQNDFTELVPDMTWTGVMWMLAKPAADLATEAVCERLYSLMLPYQERMSFTGFTSLGPMHSALALLADRLGREDDGARHRDAADAVTRRLHAIKLG